MTDNLDGTYLVVWKPHVSGTYTIAVSLFGEQLEGSPFVVHSSTNNPVASKCIVRGDALNPKFVVACALAVPGIACFAFDSQGAGATSVVDRRATDPSLGVGLLVGPAFDSELMVTNTRFFGHALQAIELGGGAHTLLSNNVITENSIAARGNASGVLVRANVSDFIVQGNHIGDLAWAGASQRHGVCVEAGGSDRARLRRGRGSSQLGVFWGKGRRVTV